MGSRITSAILSALLCICNARDDRRAQYEQAPPKQTNIGAAPGIPLSASQPIWRAQDVIYKANPDIAPATIERDKAALGMAYHAMWTQTSDSQISDADAGNLLATIWIDYRVGHPKSSINFDKAKVVVLANGYGGLHIKTSPARAAVWVDDKKWDGLTELTAYTTAGKRRIRVGGLPGYKDDEEMVEVVATTIVEFQRTLIKIR